MKPIAVSVLAAGFALSSAALASTPVREVRMREVVLGSTLPADLTSPEGKSRWHLESLPLGAASTIAIVSGETGSFALETRSSAAEPASSVGFSGGDQERWLLPDRDPSQLKMGTRTVLAFDETRHGLGDRIAAQIDTIGIGWVHLPSGPKEVVLQRVLVSRRRAGERSLRPDVVLHRWVGPREGVLAEVSGPASGDGRTRLAIDRASVVEAVITGAADLKVYAEQLYRGTFVDVKYGWDRGAGTPVSAVIPGVTNACELVNLPSWDFSATTSGAETATTTAPVNLAETCNAARCGYSAGGILERLDRNLTGTLRKDNQVVQREDRPGDVTFWLRAGTQNENRNGFFGTGESRFCFTDEAGKDRAEVPLWQMTHNDAAGWYTQAADTWSSVPVVSPACQETFYTLVCGATQPLTPNPLYSRACTDAGQTYGGKQSGKVEKAGVATLPSGHTLNALVIRNTTEFCVYSNTGCTALLDKVRTIVCYWQVPYLGSVALIRGPKRVDFAGGEVGETPCTNFTTLDFTDIGYGLFPPVSITAGVVTDTSVSISWNPGNDTHRIVGYKIYWDTDPGASTNYAFDSVANAGQVAFAGTTATISGLTPGTAYYFTVTSLSDFTDPSSSVLTRYESIRYPTTVSGDPSFSYPVEVTATTTCPTPTQEVTGLTVDKATPNIHVCWALTVDPCSVGYDILASADKTSDAGWTVVGQVGATACWDGNPSQTFYLVRSRGTGGTGPWGHYGH